MVDMICRLNITQVTILSSAGYQKPSFAFLITTELEKQSNWVVRFAMWGACEFFFLYIKETNYILVLIMLSCCIIRFILLRLRDNHFSMQEKWFKLVNYMPSFNVQIVSQAFSQ